MRTEDNKGIESRIIEAAKSVFTQKGYEATTMKDIATEAGISRTAMHYYFRTKEMMFETIFMQLITALLPNINLIVMEETTVLEKLPKIIDVYLRIVNENFLLPLFVIVEVNRDPEHVFNTVIKNYESIRPLLKLKMQIEDEMEKGLINKMPLVHVASTFLSLIAFPTLIKNVISMVFMNGNAEEFSEFILSRKQLIYNIMYNLLSPDRNTLAK